MKRIFLIALAGIGLLNAQSTAVPGSRTFTGAVDMSGASSEKPRQGVTLPSTCTMGESYLLTLVTFSIYYCTATNTWTQETSGSITNPYFTLSAFAPYSIVNLHATGNSGASMNIVPSGTGFPNSSLHLLNADDTSKANTGQFVLTLAGATASLQSQVGGTGTPVTVQNFGETANGNSLNTINFQFNGVTKHTFTPTTLSVATGTNVLYRCATAGALPVGALTINAASCGSTADTGLRVP